MTLNAQIKPIKTGIIGYGYSAQTFHIPFIQALPDFTLDYISTSKPDTVKHALPDISLYSTAESLITQSDAELLIITAPNHAHFSLAKLALEHDKHVVLEKPFVNTYAEGQQLITLAKAQSRVLSVYHNRRWDGDFLTVKKLIDENRLGEVRIFESHFNRLRPNVRKRWREDAGIGNGILYDLGPHLIDQCLQLFGMPQTISAQCQAIRDGSENTDFFSIVLQYPKMRAVLQSSPYYAAPNCRFNLQGTLGQYIVNGTDPQEGHLKTGVQPTDSDWSQELVENYGTLHQADKSSIVPTENKGYEHYFKQLAAAIKDGETNPVTAESALQSIKLIEMAMQSSESGRTLTISD